MRRAWQTARATSTGLSHELIRVEQERSRAYGNLRSLEAQAAAYPGEIPRRPGETEAEVNERRNARENALSEQRQRLRQALKDHPEQLAAALQDLEQGRGADLSEALAVAAIQLQRVDEEINALRAEQGRHGNRAGLLRQSIDQAETWLAQHPEALREDVVDEEAAA